MERYGSFSSLLYIRNEKLKEKKWYFNEDTPFLEDVEYFLKICYSCDNIYLKNDALYHYCLNNNGMMQSRKSYEKNIKGLLDLREKLASIIKKNDYKYQERIKIVDTIQTNLILNYAYLSYKNNKNNKIFDNLKNIIKSRQFQEMKGNFDYSLLPFNCKLQLMALKNSRIEILRILFEIKRICNFVKKIVK